MEEKKGLELRMYFFVPYNIMPIQQGIQAGHSLGEYALKYGRYDQHHIVWEFLEKQKTFMIMNGGTTNDERVFEMIPTGTLNQIADEIEKSKVDFSCFIEPDLNRALSAVCVIIDERVFNKEDYPDFQDYIINEIGYPRFLLEYDDMRKAEIDAIEEWFSDRYFDWGFFVGGEKNIFLRELLKGKRLA